MDEVGSSRCRDKVIGGEIADGGDAGFQGAQCTFAAMKEFRGAGRIGGELLEHVAGRGFVGVLGHVGCERR